MIMPETEQIVVSNNEPLKSVSKFSSVRVRLDANVYRLFIGLYQGDRRIKARREPTSDGRARGHSRDWQVHDDEASLINDIGDSKIQSGLDVYELRKLAGLSERNELAPAILTLNDAGRATYHRVDEWGGGAVMAPGRVPWIFREEYSVKEKITDYILMLLLFWIAPAYWLSRRISNGWNLGLAVFWLVACMVGINIGMPWIGGSDLVELLIIIVIGIPGLIFFVGALRGQ